MGEKPYSEAFSYHLKERVTSSFFRGHPIWRVLMSDEGGVTSLLILDRHLIFERTARSSLSYLEPTAK